MSACHPMPHGRARLAAPLARVLALLMALPLLAAPLVLAAPLALAAREALAQAGRTSGLPLPRFVSLGSDRVNFRFGPGTQYPIHWVLVREGLPVEIIKEFDTWRKVRLHDGDLGWIHSSLLSGRRTIMVADEVRALRRTPDPAARVVLRAEPGVIGRLLGCDEGWCRVEIEGRRGWLPRDAFWGTLPDETLP